MRARPRHIIAAAALLALTSCLTPTGKQRPADLVTYGAKAGAGSTGIHTVLPGDTVYTVSKRYNLPLREIIALNDLSPPYRLGNGYRLKLPPPNEYKVRPGDTLNGVSRLFNASVSEIARLNNLAAPYTVQRGQVLRLPSSQPKLAEEFAAAPASSPGADFSSEVSTTTAYKVGAVESETLAPPPATGEALPAVTSPAALKPAAGFPPQPVAKSASALPVETPPGAVTAAPPAKLQTASVPPSVVPKIPARTGSGKFMRPVDGKIISGYGPKDDGLHNDGINIKAAKGTAVRAAENGVVAYTGSGMSGYGNLVLIRHEGRWMTAYAHLDKVLVKKGDTVKAGQSIGTVGATGQVDSAQLHFEIRKGTQAVDPAGYL